MSLKLRNQIEWNIIIDFGSQYLEWMKKDLTQLDETLPKMVEASDDQYDVIEKFHDCDYELRHTGAMISYVLDSQS